MKNSVRRIIRRDNTARNAWIVFGGLVALGVLAMTVRELPSIRREARLMRM
jgi:hypothetical protein